MKRLSTTIVFLIVSAIACKESAETPARGNSGSDAGMTQSAPASSPDSIASPAPLANPGEAASLATPEVTAVAALNPPHGQPNHRCDIPVGAPLSQSPGSQTALPNPSQLNVPAQTATPTTAAGMNPPHGQPNHRCDIAVGAPLSTPPAQTK